MNEALQKYFALHHYLLLPGIGSIKSLFKEPSLDFINKEISPAQQQLFIYKNDEEVDKKLIRFLSGELEVEETVAEETLRSYTYNLQLQLLQNNEVNIDGIGTIRQKNNVQEMIAKETSIQLFPTLTAERIIRKHNEHLVRRGEQHIASSHIKNGGYQHAPVAKDRWWIAAIIILVIAVGGALLFLLRDKLF